MAVTLAGAALAACALSALLIRLLHPLLVRYALARPNARSSHTIPTPQGGGIAVIAATLVLLAAGSWWLGVQPDPGLLVVTGGTVLVAIVGAVDDVRPLSPAFRLLVQAVGVSAIVWVGDERVLPEPVPLAAEQALLVLAGLWWVNLVNFMDGIDWMTVATGVPLALALAGFGLAGFVGTDGTLLAACLAGALLGFAPANRPVARLFLGDVGSLPIGLLTGALLLDLARHGALAAALLLPLYYLGDATVTLLRRLAAGERVWEAHRSHFYQRALLNGFSVPDVVRIVFGLNLLLIALAAATLVWPSRLFGLWALALGAGLVAVTLVRFARAPRVVRGRA